MIELTNDGECIMGWQRNALQLDLSPVTLLENMR